MGRKSSRLRPLAVSVCLLMAAVPAILVLAYGAGGIGATGARAAAPVGLPGSTARRGAVPQRPRSTSLVISQVYGGGGNTGAPWRNDFIELFNPTTNGVDISGWS